MYTIQEVAINLKVSNRTVYRWIKEGKLKSLKIQGIVRITEEEYQSFIKNQ
jgi:excisionase family DNA binding protein